VKKLREYKGVSHLKRAAINILVKMSNEDETKTMTEQFRRLDIDGSGMISIDEMTLFMTQRNSEISSDEIKRIFKEVDYVGNGKINYSEFLSATLDIQHFLTDSKLRSVFNVFDTDQSGFITAENIKFAF
jgi:calcium-dependent protein kinase